MCHFDLGSACVRAGEIQVIMCIDSRLKTAFGISSRSLVHHWDKAGAPGQIPGYATHVNATSRAAKYMQDGYIGIGIGAWMGTTGVGEGGENVGEILFENTRP